MREAIPPSGPEPRNQAPGIEIAGSDPGPEAVPGPPPSFKMLMVGMDMATGGTQIEKDDKAVPSWEMVIAILSTALEIAKFHRNIGHGAVMQAQAQRVAEEQHVKAMLANKGRVRQ